MMSEHSRESSEYSKQEVEDAAPSAPPAPGDNKKAKKLVYSLMFSEWIAIFAIIPSFIAGIVQIILYLFVGNIISICSDYSLKNIDDPLPPATKQIIYLLICITVTSICSLLGSMLWMRVGTRISVKVRDQMFSSLMKYDVAYFDTNSIGTILTILGEDAATLQESFGSIKHSQIQNFSGFITAFIFLFVISWKLGLVLVAFVPVALLIMKAFQAPIVKQAIMKFTFITSSITIAEEAISSIRTVKGFNAEEAEIERFTQQTETAAKHDRKLILTASTMFMCFMVFTWGFIAGVVYYGATMVGTKQNGQMFTPGRLVSVFGYCVLACFNLIVLQNTFQTEARAIQSGQRVLKLLEYQPSINFEGGEKPNEFKGHIEFKNVTFRYPTRKTNALTNVSFEIKPGEYLALVGHAGSGKSTCVQLIERFYDVTEGIITIDGRDIKELDPRWLHRKMALVSQEPTLFHGSVKENVCYGLEGEVDDEKVWNALEEANAKKFVSKFGDNLAHAVGDKGTSLSGGQRQRIAIARAVIKNPDILITDEATSALDSESEKKVQEALDRIIKSRTGIVVAHRLSTIINCTRIIVFDGGQIVETGTHDSLLEQKGFYYNLVKRQLQGNTSESDKVA